MLPVTHDPDTAARLLGPAEIRQIGEVTYYNDGDWVESCTALVEHSDGRMEIIDWAGRKRDEAMNQKAVRKAKEEAAA